MIAAGRGARRAAAARLLGVAVVVALLVVALRAFDFARVFAQLGGARPAWVGAALLCYLAILPLWAWQWRVLAPAPRPTYARMLGVVAMTSSVLNTAPLLAGEMAAVGFLVTRARIGRAAAVSMLAMDQLLVGLAKVVVFMTAAAMLALPLWMWRGAATLFGGVALLLGGLAWLAWRGRARPESVGPSSARIGALLASLGEALAPLRSPSRVGGAMLLALAKKLAEIAAMLCVARAFGVAVPFVGGVLVLAALNLATLLPIVPGGIGLYEAAVVVAYRHLGIGGDAALAIAVVQHACYFAALALPGYRWLARAVVSRSVIAAP